MRSQPTFSLSLIAVLAMVMFFVTFPASVLADDEEAIPLESKTLASADLIHDLSPSIWSGILKGYDMTHNLPLTMPGATSVNAQPPEEEEDNAPLPEEEEDMPKDSTGTDPRDFTSKFMPYYRYTELENKIEIHTLTMFGMLAFNPRFAMTYEWPMMQHQDYEDWKVWKQLNQMAPGTVDEETHGMGDLNLRFFLRPKEWEWKYMDGTKSGSFMPILETTLPTANEDLLGGDRWVVSPGFCIVLDMPFESAPLGLGFVAMMNFYDFDALSDDDSGDVGGPIDNDDQDNDISRFRGRWFWMQPLSKPASMDNPDDKAFHIFDTAGLYLLTEFQPIYDFEEDDFSFWVGPEFGKVIHDGHILYLKPGWGIDNEKGRMSGDRKFSFEVGYRFFF